jgi:hypothetical protein
MAQPSLASSVISAFSTLEIGQFRSASRAMLENFSALIPGRHGRGQNRFADQAAVMEEQYLIPIVH